MSLEQIKSTSLWINAFENQELARYSDDTTRLKNELIRMREKVSALVTKIGQILPGLTVHDTTHLDALWKTAETISGKNYELNPLETFIFGSAVLLHDTAMCWEAYEGGQTGIRDTLIWKDSYAFELRRLGEGCESEAAAAADFSAIRQLHASRAAELPRLSWRIPGSGEAIHLIGDESIRIHLGELIGLIAESHHWDIGDVAEKLNIQFNSPDFLSAQWAVDPVKIACLLRVADAAHISSARAPDFLFALNRRTGISLEHWIAQNKISGPQLDLHDKTGSSITYTSTAPYPEAEANAWWIAFDTISMINSEIKSCNELLEARRVNGSHPFAVRMVSGAGSIEEIKKYIRVTGWTPVNTQIHVSDIEGLVKNLGGEKLYGSQNKLEVVLRELIQNARDAIAARRQIDNGYIGKVTIKLNTSQAKQANIIIADNGVGMSKSVLLGPFLDFGSSFWSSRSLQSELPGLSSSAFVPIGQFGIGFYSIFMAASSVEVHSRRWVENRNYSCSLIFPKGLTLRPIFKESNSSNLPTDVSTEVRMCLTSEALEADGCLPFSTNLLGAKKGRAPIKDFISSLVVGLDVDVYFEEGSNTPELIHSAATTEGIDAKSILMKIGCNSSYPLGIDALNQEISEITPRMRKIEENGKLLGYAALATTSDSGLKMLGVKTIGGVVSSNSSRSDLGFFGYIECSPKSASRDINAPLASQQKLKEWAEEQINILEQNGCDELTRLIAATGAASFNADVTDFARMYVIIDNSPCFLSFKQIAEVSKKIPVGFLISQLSSNHIETHHSIDGIEGVAHIKPLMNGAWLNFELDNNRPKRHDSIAGYIHKSIESLGLDPVWQLSDQIYQVHFGKARLATIKGITKNKS